MILKQLNPGTWVGGYYTEFQNGISMSGMISVIFNMSTLWIVGQTTIKNIIPWFNYTIFLIILLLTVFIILPSFHYFLIYKPSIEFLNIQRAKHKNPEIDLINKLIKQNELIIKTLNIKEEE